MTMAHAPTIHKYDSLKIGDQVVMHRIPNGSGNIDYDKNIAEIVNITKPGNFGILIKEGRMKGITTTWYMDSNNWDFELVNNDWDK